MITASSWSLTPAPARGFVDDIHRTLATAAVNGGTTRGDLFLIAFSLGGADSKNAGGLAAEEFPENCSQVQFFSVEDGRRESV